MIFQQRNIQGEVQTARGCVHINYAINMINKCKFILIILVYTMIILDFSLHSFYYMDRILVNMTSL